MEIRAPYGEEGAFLWQLAVPKLTTSRFRDWPKSGIRSTATVEGDRTYVVSNRGEVMCLDVAGQANGNDGSFQDEARHAVPEGEGPVPLTSKDADILWAFDMIKECGVRQHDQAHSSITPLFPPSGPALLTPQGPPAKINFLAAAQLRTPILIRGGAIPPASSTFPMLAPANTLTTPASPASQTVEAASPSACHQTSSTATRERSSAG